jgi:hypothetical protein
MAIEGQLDDTIESAATCYCYKVKFAGKADSIVCEECEYLAVCPEYED